jgi:hypothetical protein
MPVILAKRAITVYKNFLALVLPTVAYIGRDVDVLFVTFPVP